jgi:hypothetical protein
MFKPTRKTFFIFIFFKLIFKSIFRFIYIVLAASMIGFSNAYYDESKWVNDLKSHPQQEQVFNNEDK